MSALTAMTILPRAGAVLIASANPALREQVAHRLNGRCPQVQQALGGADALAKLENGDWQVLFLDRHLPDLDAEEVLSIIQRRFPGLQVVMLGADDDQHAAEGQVLPSPGSGGEEFPAMPQSARELRVVEPAVTAPLPGMIGSSPAMQRVYRMVHLIAPRMTTVLIVGATGTGKELVARALHALSPRASKPLVVVNCAAIPEALLESELFGYTRGAFTGAVQSQLGRIPAAHGGTLLLDEVSELPLGMQAKLLRFLEQKEIQRLGTSEALRVDVRVLAASNVDLAGRAARGEFRQDLFYRLAAFPIEVPTLAERGSDIAALAAHFLASMAAALEMPRPRLSRDAVRLLEAHPWRGNVRELQHVMERASILAGDSETVEAEHLYFSSPRNLLPRALPSES